MINSMKLCRKKLHEYDRSVFSRCPTCEKLKKRNWKLSNIEVNRLHSREYYRRNREKVLNKIKLRSENNKEQISEKRNRYENLKKKTDPNYKLKCVLRNRLHQAVQKNYKSGSAVRDLGCTIPELKAYLEARFQPGMTWENWGKGSGYWNIDHIKPLSGFDLMDPIQFRQAVHYTNLQPLWAEENLRKGGHRG